VGFHVLDELVQNLQKEKTPIEETLNEGSTFVFIIYSLCYLQTGVSNVPHCVLEGPNDRVKYQLELCRRNIQECWEAMVVHRLKKIQF
jgi:hypothetical protein